MIVGSAFADRKAWFGAQGMPPSHCACWVGFGRQDGVVGVRVCHHRTCFGVAFGQCRGIAAGGMPPSHGGDKKVCVSGLGYATIARWFLGRLWPTRRCVLATWGMPPSHNVFWVGFDR